jgi:hypothetical protein
LLMLYREPTGAQAFCLLNSSTTIYSTDATFPNSAIFLSATTISSTATLYFTE